MTTHTCTVVGVFSDYQAAEAAARDLTENGIERNAIHIQTANRTTTAGKTEYAGEEREGGVAGFFRNLFGSDDSEAYHTAVESGRTVLTADVSQEQSARTAEVLQRHGASGVDQNADAGKSGTSSLPVIEEELRVGKRSVQHGGVRVYSHVVERPVDEKVTLREEHVTVERRPVDRPATSAELSGLRDQSFEMNETMEEPVIEKHARVTEEVILGRKTTERTRNVHDTVRHTEVKTERLGNPETPVSEDEFRDHWRQNYAGLGGEYASFRPAYQYGYRLAGEPRYQGREWSEIEPEIRSSYERDNPDSAWERIKGAVRHGWERMTNRK